MRVRAPSRKRRGHVTVVVAVSLVTLLSFVALSIDGGLLMDQHRKVRSAADAAAIAAAGDLYYNFPVNRGLDPNGTAKAAALAAASANGFTHGVNSTVTVNILPQSGPFTTVPGHAEVIITFNQPRHFSKLFGSTAIPIRGRAVARGRKTVIRNAIICLDPDDRSSLNAAGNGTATVTGANIQVNSTDYMAMVANGNGTLAAQQFDVGGSPGYATPGNGRFTGPIVPNSEPIPDPLRFLPPPDPNTMTVRSTRRLQISSAGTIILQPGVYIDGITVTGQANVTLMPGIYYMKCGGFNFGGMGSLTGIGVMIYNAPCSSSDVINISGQGNVTLSPPMSGPYQGLCIFQERSSTNTVSIQGAQYAAMSISGTFYVAGGLLSVTGNGQQQTIGSQYISDTLMLGGNGNYSVNWDPTLTPGKREVLLVE
jgi:hypothetical protein